VNEIYAVDPFAAKKIEELQSLVAKFGFTEGRFIAKFPIDWADLLKVNFKNLDGPKRLKLLNCIKQFEGSSLAINDISYRRTKDWLENAKDRSNFLKFNGIISEKEDQSFKCLSLEGALYNNELSDSRACIVDSNINEYIRLMQPLLSVSSELYIQDVNLELYRGLEKRRRAQFFIYSLLEKIKEVNRCKKGIFILGEEKYPSSESRIKVKNTIQDIANDIGLLNFLTEVRFSNKKLCHGRYVFSMYGAIKFDYGFDTPKDAKNEVLWCSETILEDLKNMHCKY
jgi:hypothetical protein